MAQTKRALKAAEYVSETWSGSNQADVETIVSANRGRAFHGVVQQDGSLVLQDLQAASSLGSVRIPVGFTYVCGPYWGDPTDAPYEVLSSARLAAKYDTRP